MSVPSLRPESPPSITISAYNELHEAPFTADYRRETQSERLLELRKSKRKERVEALREKNFVRQPLPAAALAAAFAQGEFSLTPAAGAERVEATAAAATPSKKATAAAAAAKPAVAIGPLPVKKSKAEKVQAVAVAATKPAKKAESAAGAKPLAHVSPLIPKKPKPEKSAAAIQKDQKEPLKKASEKELFEIPAAAAAAGAAGLPQELTAKIAEHRALLLKLAPGNLEALLAELLETEKRFFTSLSVGNNSVAFLQVMKAELDIDLLEQTKKMINGVPEFNQILKAGIQSSVLQLRGMASDAQVEIVRRIQREADERLDDQYNL